MLATMRKCLSSSVLKHIRPATKALRVYVDNLAFYH